MLWSMPETQREADQRRPAVGDERQRDPGDRHDPEDHPDVDDELEQDHRREPAPRTSSPNGSLRAPGRRRASARAARRTGRRRRSAPTNPSSSAQDREHEVASPGPAGSRAGSGSRSSGPCRTARPSRPRSGTGELVAGALGVGARVEEAEQPLLLVVAQDVRPDDRHGGEDRDADQRRASVRLAPDMNSIPARIAPNTSDVPEVGLEQHEQPRRRDEHAAPRIDGASRAPSWRAPR